jgi:hypothetical protein
MAKSDLLKEAIADAKAVKDTALENAKLALQEAFEPRVKEMLSRSLRTELEGEDEFGDDMPVDAPMGDEAGMEGGDEFGDEGEGVEWVDNDLSFKVGGQEFQAQVDNPMGDEEDFGDEEEFGGEEEFGDEMPEEDDELNLENIIRELEGAEEVPVDAGQPGDIEGEEDTELTMGESIDDIIESILAEEYDEEEDVKEGKYGKHGKKHMEEAYDDEEVEELQAENAELKEELEEAYSTVTELKSILSEVNLLNAKLLYTNKLFRNFELTEAQKMKVIENFDRTVTTREVKLVFTTLAESFNKPRGKRSPSIVKESVASKPVASTAPKKETTQVLSEGFEQANRWKKLAGLL